MRPIKTRTAVSAVVMVTIALLWLVPGEFMTGSRAEATERPPAAQAGADPSMRVPEIAGYAGAEAYFEEHGIPADVAIARSFLQ
jgi:hypothetical protein